MAGIVVLTALYYGAAHLSFALNFAGPVASIVWLPVGVGIAFLYVAGVEFWPGVLFGELLIGDWAFGIGSSLGQTLANVLEVVVAVVILRRLLRRDSPLGTVAGVAITVLAIAAGVAVSATIGALSLRLGGVVTTGALARVWRTWWLGDFAGALIVVPLGLAWCSWPRIACRRQRLPEAALTLTAIAAAGALGLGVARPATYLAFAALIWSGLRLGQRAATLAVAGAAAFAVWTATHSVGPLHSYALDRVVLETQLFIVVASLSTLCLAAAINERNVLAVTLRRSLSRTVEVSERERRRLERDLHDGAQARLVAIQIRLELARGLTDRAEVDEQIDETQRDLEAAIEELRGLAQGIYPRALRDLGPAGALQSLAASSVVPMYVIDEGVGRSPDATEEAIYFCAREAIQNTAKHAGPNVKSMVTLRRVQNSIELTVRDDGTGIPADRGHEGTGITGMRDRIEAVGGRLEIVFAPGEGTSILAVIPDRKRRPPREQSERET
jgi:signal transduction histidine kinase